MRACVSHKMTLIYQSFNAPENCVYGHFSEKLSIYQQPEDKLKSHGRSLLVSALFHVTEDLRCTVVTLLLL